LVLARSQEKTKRTTPRKVELNQMKYCQGTKCHEYRTKDRIRGMKGDKYYETRKNKSFYNNEFCSNMCRDDWFNDFGKRAIDHFGRTVEPKRTGCNNAWYKDYKYIYNLDGQSRYSHFIANDLLGEKRSITEAQYNDENYINTIDKRD
jgi:hypothetical protein